MMIYVRLPKEAVPVWAPVEAEKVGDDLYRIVDGCGEEGQIEFGGNAVVRCRLQRLGDGEYMVAYERGYAG